MKPMNKVFQPKEAFVFGKKGEVYVIYVPGNSSGRMDLSEEQGDWEISWYNPWEGGDLSKGYVGEVEGGKHLLLGKPPYNEGKDWVVLLKKKI